MRSVMLTLACCFALVALALASPDAQAGARANGCSAHAACSVPDLADDGCSAPAVSCGGHERSILKHHGDGHWFPGKLALRGTGRALRGVTRVAFAPVRLAGRVMANGVERRHARRHGH